MASNSAKDKLAALPDELKEKLSNGAKSDESITDMASKLGLDYKVTQTYLWQSGTLL